MDVHQDLRDLLENQLEFARTLHQLGDLAPLAAWMGADGAITGQAFVSDERVSLDRVLNHFKTTAREAMDAGTIRASVILFHGYQEDGVGRVAYEARDARALIAWLEHANGQKVEASISYGGETLFRPMPAAPPDELVVFMAKTYPREGESTVLRIATPLVDLLQSQLPYFRALGDGGGVVPILSTLDFDGVIAGFDETVQGVKESRSLYALINFYSGALRWHLDNDLLKGGAIFSYAILGNRVERVTSDRGEATGIVVWLADRRDVFQVRLPDDGTGPTAESFGRLPLYSGQQVLAVVPPASSATGGDVATWIRELAEGASVIRDWQRIDDDFQGLPPTHARAITENGRFMMTAHDGQTILWDVPDKSVLQVVRTEGHHTALAFSSGDKVGLLGHADGAFTAIRFFPD